MEDDRNSPAMERRRKKMLSYAVNKMKSNRALELGKLRKGSPECKTIALQLLRAEFGLRNNVDQMITSDFSDVHFDIGRNSDYQFESESDPYDDSDESKLIDILGIDKYLDMMSRIEDELVEEHYMACMGEYGSAFENEIFNGDNESWMSSVVFESAADHQGMAVEILDDPTSIDFLCPQCSEINLCINEDQSALNCVNCKFSIGWASKIRAGLNSGVTLISLKSIFASFVSNHIAVCELSKQGLCRLVVNPSRDQADEYCIQVFGSNCAFIDEAIW